MSKLMYHATSQENLDSILSDGIRRGIDGVVYLCEKPVDAVKFLAIRLIRDIVVFAVRVDEDEMEESFDHNKNFFGCSAYMVSYDIPTSDIDLNKSFQYNL